MTKNERIADINTRLLVIGLRYEEIKYRSDAQAEREWLALLDETSRLMKEKRDTI